MERGGLRGDEGISNDDTANCSFKGGRLISGNVTRGSCFLDGEERGRGRKAARGRWTDRKVQSCRPTPPATLGKNPKPGTFLKETAGANRESSRPAA